ncbi:MAG: DUF1801 domain-containing protein [Sphingobacteriales bacterium]|nr:MAG: DUF1801 domain-containing protein [Sphingobacteriales bacterium]
MYNDAVTAYISGFEPTIRERLNALRTVFHEELPQTEESIRYRMPAFTVGEKGYLYFAAYKQHIGFYPVYGLVKLAPEIEQYKAKKAKDTLHFMHDQPLPLALVRQIIRYKSK